MGRGIRLLVAAALVLFATAADAQPKRQAPPGARPTDDMSPLQVHQLFDAMLAMQAQEALSLDESQYARFLTRLKVLQDTRRRHQRERLQLIAELQRLTNPRATGRASEAEVTARLTALQELEGRAAAELRRAYNDVDELLTPLQRARFRVLEEQIERRKFDLVGRARQNNGRPAGRRPPGR